MSLLSKINDEDMVDISLNMDKFTTIVKLLNQHQKEQDQRLSQLELKIDEMQKEIRDTTFKDNVTSKIESLEVKVKNLEDEIQNTKISCDNKIENSINELIVQQTVQNRNLLEGFESRMRELSDSIQEVKTSTDEKFSKDIEDLNSRLKHIYSKIIKTPMKDITDSTPDNNIESLKKEIMDNIDEKFASIQKSISAYSKNRPTNSEYDDLLDTSESEKTSIIQLALKIEELSQKVDNLNGQNVPQKKLDISNKSNQENSLDPIFEKNQALSENMALINISITQQQEEINRIKKYLSHRALITRPIFYALIDDLLLIHSHADGMEGIPVQNFRHVSPNYFNDDEEYLAKTTWYCSRFPAKSKEETKTDDKGNSKEKEETIEKVENKNDNDKVNDNDDDDDDELPLPPPAQSTPPSKNVEKVSNPLNLNQDVANGSILNNSLLQSQIQKLVKKQVKMQLQALVMESRRRELGQPENTDGVISETSNRGLTHIVKDEGRTVINNFQNNTVEILGTTGRPKPTLSRTVNFVVVDMKIVGSLNFLSESEISQRTRELTFLLGQFKREKDQLMSVIERKVDRDFVERLFDKFRVLLNDVNDKVSIFQQGSEKFATISQIQEVFRMIDNVKSNLINLISNPTAAAGKRSGQECLFCGRKISLVAGGISARSLGDYEESSQFVYGDGGVFKKANTIGSNEIKKTKLPPLKNELT